MEVKVMEDCQRPEKEVFIDKFSQIPIKKVWTDKENPRPGPQKTEYIILRDTKISELRLNEKT